jgi:hypothetical protein
MSRKGIAEALKDIARVAGGLKMPSDKKANDALMEEYFEFLYSEMKARGYQYFHDFTPADWVAMMDGLIIKEWRDARERVQKARQDAELKILKKLEPLLESHPMLGVRCKHCKTELKPKKETKR